MKVEREIAGTVFPYVAGIASAVYSGAYSFGAHAVIICITSCITALFILLLTRGRKRLYIPAFFMCGVLTGLTGIETSVSTIEAAEGLSNGFNGFMDKAIGRIGFAEEEASAVMKALLTGNRNEMSRETIEAFRASGASHILALSGFHLGIIYLIIKRILSLLGNTWQMKASRSALCIIVCLLYTLATGAGPSIVRALIFITTGEIATLSQRHHTTGSILMTAAMIQLTLSPLSIQNLGFQLSYSAMAGIAFIYPRIKGLWKEDKTKIHPAIKPVKWIWNSMAISLSCQLTTGPLAYFYFHTFPQHFLLTNLIAIPLTSLIIPFSLATLICSIAGLDINILTRATEGLITALSDALHIIASM